MEINQFKIFDIVSSHKDDASYWHIDFKRDLKPDKALSKTVTFAINGRPQASTYTYNGVEMARIRWTFTNFPNSFLMMTRREEISYVLLDGTDGPWFLKDDQTYNLDDTSHRDKVLNERVLGRKFVLNDIKGIVMAALKDIYVDKSEDEITEMGGLFWEIHSSTLSSFVDTGSKLIVTAIGLDETTIWLSDLIAPGITIGQYMQSKLSF